MVSNEDLFRICADKGLRAQISADQYAKIWKHFNLILLKQIKSRKSVFMKDIFACRFNETYEGAERHLDGTLDNCASRLVTPHGHAVVDVIFELSDKFMSSYGLSGKERRKKFGGDDETELESALARLRQEEAILKATDKKNPRLLDIWADIRRLTQQLADLRRTLQGKWLRGVTLELGSNQWEWAPLNEISFIQIGQAASVDKSVAEAALVDLFHEFGALAEQKARANLRGFGADQGVLQGETVELLLVNGRLEAAGGAVTFIGKPIHALTGPKDALRLPTSDLRAMSPAVGAPARPFKGPLGASATAAAAAALRRGLTPMTGVRGPAARPGTSAGGGGIEVAAQRDAHTAPAAESKPQMVGPAIMKRPKTQQQHGGGIRNPYGSGSGGLISSVPEEVGMHQPAVTGHTEGYMTKTANDAVRTLSRPHTGAGPAQPWAPARTPLTEERKQAARDAFYQAGPYKPPPAGGGGDTPLSRQDTAAAGPGGGDAGGGERRGGGTALSYSTAGGESCSSTRSVHRRRHHRDGSVTVRNPDGTTRLVLGPAGDGADAKAEAMRRAQERYRDLLRRREEGEKMHNAEILERRQQAEYAANMQRTIRAQMERERLDFLRLQVENKVRKDKEERDYLMAPTTLYPAAVPAGRSALWMHQLKKDVSDVMRETYKEEMERKEKASKAQREKEIAQERKVLDRIGEGIVLDHIALQAQRNAHRERLLKELDETKRIKDIKNPLKVPFDPQRPCID